MGTVLALTVARRPLYPRAERLPAHLRLTSLLLARWMCGELIDRMRSASLFEPTSILRSSVVIGNRIGKRWVGANGGFFTSG